MAELRLLNEFGRSNVVLALEPARRCVAHCTYCFAELNRRQQAAGKERRDAGDDGTFESLVERAMGLHYDPTDFRQWTIRNRVPVAWSNTVEPFQDLPQARGILKIADRLDLPLFVQTKGHHWREVWDLLKRRAGNAALFVSCPSLDERVVKRFEPNTPPVSERVELMKAAAEAGFHVILALSPYHEEWCADPVPMIEAAHSWGVKEVFFDRLHLTPRQRKVCHDPVTVRLASSPSWPALAVEHAEQILQACVDLGIDFTTNKGEASVHEIYGTTTAHAARAFARGTDWPYHEFTVLSALEDLFGDDPGPSIVVTWDATLRSMESESRIDQPFSFSSMSELRVVREIPPSWRETLKPAAPVREYLRAIWNAPDLGFVSGHPFVRVAVKPGGEAHRDADGNVVLLYDPDYGGKNLLREVESLEAFRTLTFDDDDGPQPAGG